MLQHVSLEFVYVASDVWFLIPILKPLTHCDIFYRPIIFLTIDIWVDNVVYWNSSHHFSFRMEGVIKVNTEQLLLPTKILIIAFQLLIGEKKVFFFIPYYTYT